METGWPYDVLQRQPEWLILDILDVIEARAIAQRQATNKTHGK